MAIYQADGKEEEQRFDITLRFQATSDCSYSYHLVIAK